MAKFLTGRWGKRCRRCLRVLRISIVLLLFVVVAAGVYLNEVGLPGFLKTALLERLHERGLQLQFTRLRWHLFRGFVAEDVHLERANATASDPRFSAKEVALKPIHRELLKFHWVLDSIILRNGQLTWPVGETNGHPRSLSMTNIQAQLRFRPGDKWQLDHFIAAFGGAKLHFAGSVTNASALRDWKLFQGTTNQPEATRKYLHDLADTLDEIHFFAPPELLITLDGDARDPQTFQGLLTLKAADARTPWGSMTNGAVVVRLSPPNATNRVASIAGEVRAADAATPWGSLTNGVLVVHINAPDLTNYAANAAFELRASGAGTRWAAGQNLQLTLHGARDTSSTNIVRAVLEAHADNVKTEWAQAQGARLAIHWTHSLTNAIPLDGTTDFSLNGIHTRWAELGNLHLSTLLNTPAATGPLHADERWAWWAKLERYSLDWNCTLNDIRSPKEDPASSPKFELHELACAGLWRGPMLTLTNLSAQLYGGHFSVWATMDVSTRAVTFDATSDFDVQRINPFLPKDSRDWLEQFSWEQPPLAHSVGGVILPAWTNRQPDWNGEVYPTLWMQGDLKAGSAAYKKVPVMAVQSHFSLTNVVWTLPDLVATRPEGKLELFHTSDDRHHIFYFHAKSTIDPKILRPLLTDPDARDGMDDFVLTAPPKIDGEIWGRWRDNNSVGFKAHTVLTNFTFRHQSVSSFVGDFSYTNKFMVLLNGRIDRGSRYMTASGLGVDFPRQQLYLTNGYSTMEAMPVARAISAKVTQTIEPYQFLQPPVVHAHGTIPLVDEVPADLHFQVDGGPFRWLKFNLDHVSGEVNWVGDSLTVTNARAAFYGGNLEGHAAFDFTPPKGTDFSFNVFVTNANLHSLMTDVLSSTNRLEGLLSGHLNIDHANSDDWKSWSGNGDVTLRDGLIWDIPVFGRMSHFLDDIHGGLGESRAKEGSATFTITDSVIHSDTVQIRATGFYLHYWGNVDFNGKVDATMEAQVFRGVPLIGGVVSTALLPFTKFFESNVTGTLDDPKVSTRYLVPRLLLAPFHPIRAVDEILGGSSSSNLPPYQAPVFNNPTSTNNPVNTNNSPLPKK